MAIEVIPPTTLNSLPVTVACESVTVAVPELEIVKVCMLLVPAATVPKDRVVALGTKVPVAAELELFGVEPAPATPTQPEIDRTARVVMSKAIMPKDGRQLCRP